MASEVRCRVALVVLGTALWGASPRAAASPWVLPKGVVGIGITAGAGLADSEFLANGRYQRFPLEGRFDSYFLQADARFGVGSGIEVFFKTQAKGISYQSSPVLLFDPSSPPTTPDEYRSSLFNFSRRAVGLADIYLGAAFQHLVSPLRIASVLTVKVPTGYVSPRETFRNGSKVPGQVADDVTLGDGQVDIDYSLQLGYVVQASRTLFELDLGYRARLNGPGHQALGTFKLGQLIGRHVFLFAEADAAINLFQGEAIGSTFVARDPSIPADRFTPDNIEELTFRLDRSYVTVGGGIILRVQGREWVLRASRVVWGRNYSALTTLSLGVILSFR